MYLQRYGLAVVSVGFALAAALLLQHFQFRDAAVPLLLFAGAVTAWYGGPGPSVLAVLLSLMGFAYFFVPPIYSLRVAPSELPYFIIFASFTSLVTWFATIRRRVDEDLRRTRDKLKVEVEERSSLLDLTYDAIFVRDMNAIITYWNRGAEEFYGFTRQEAIGKRPGDLLHTVFPKPFEEVWEELLQTDRWEGELTHTKADGTQVIVASRWSLRRDEQRRPVAILETGNDITARKLWEEEMQALNQELAKRSSALEASNKELEAFAYSISHDLRAPLRHTAGFAELLSKSAASSLNEKSQRYLTMILEAAKRMGSLIDDLLAFSRISRAEAHNSNLSLKQLVQEAVAEVGEDASERKIVRKIDPLPDWYGDRAMLRLALVNLVFQRRKIHPHTAPGRNRNRMHRTQTRSRGTVRSRQRGRIRHEIFQQAVRRLPAASPAGSFRGYRYRLGHGSTHRTPAWRPRLGGRRGEWRRHLLLLTFQYHGS